jgi:hypothetical protein
MSSTTATTTTTSTAKAWSKAAVAALASALLAGCVDDSASYLIAGNQEHITLIRSQDWFWNDTVSLSVTVTRMPDCRGAMEVRGVPRRAAMDLYWAPEAYAQPIYVLHAGAGYYAIATASCKVQAFKRTPSGLGPPLGSFREQDGKFRFVPAQKG